MELKEINSLVELFFKKFEQITSDNFEKVQKIFLISLKEKNRGNKSFSYSWGETNTRIRILSNYLKDVISKGDRCILLSENRPEWLISDIAIMNAGGVTVPLFTTYSETDYKYIINDCDPKVCIVSNIEQFKKVKNYIKDETILISIDQFDQNILCFNKIFEKVLFNYPEKIEQMKNLYNKDIKRNDLACIIYTSGTTGNPKGVMLSHGGILSNCEGAQEILQSLIKKDPPVFLTWLPLSHSYEHTVQYVQILLGSKVFYVSVNEKSNMIKAYFHDQKSNYNLHIITSCGTQMGDPQSLLFKGLQATVRLPEASRVQLQVEPEGHWLPVSQLLNVFQASSGGEHWDSRNHVDRTGKVNLPFKGYRLQVDNTEQSGSRAAPVLVADSGVALCIDRFWQNHTFIGAIAIK